MTNETPKKKKSLLRRILKWTGITFLLLIILIIAAPFLFKKQIVQFVKDTANQELNAKVNFGEFDLTLLSSFPDFTLSVDSVSVANTGDFEGDTLLYAKNLTVGLNLMSVINGDKYEIHTISIDQPRIHALVLKDGKANWDITKPSVDTTTGVVDTTKAAPFKMGLEKFEIKNAYIVYDDASMGFYTELYNMTHTLSGDFTSDNFVLETLTEIERFTMNYGGVAYMNKVKTRIKADLDADMPKFKFSFKENEFSFNELTLGLDGFFAMPGDDMDMDLKFKANQTEFKYILSLEGVDVATNLKWIMSSNSLCFSQRPRFETWFMEGRLIPNVHYVEIAEDFSDINDKIAFYERHPEEALRIIANANAYITQFMNADDEALLAHLVVARYFKFCSPAA